MDCDCEGVGGVIVVEGVVDGVGGRGGRGCVGRVRVLGSLDGDREGAADGAVEGVAALLLACLRWRWLLPAGM